MKKTLTTITVAAVLLAPAAALYANTTDEIPQEAKAIAERLTADGWEIVDVEIEDGEIEIEAVKGETEREVVVSLETGDVLEDEQEKDDD